MDYGLHILNMVLIFAMLGVSLNLLLGYTGLLSIAHATFLGVGAYGSALVAIHLGANFFVATMFGMAIALGVAALVSAPALRVKHEYLLLLTIGVTVIFHQIALSQVQLMGGDQGLFGTPAPELFGHVFKGPLGFLPITIALTCLMFAICWRIAHSPFGRVLKTIREDEDAANALGKNVFRFKIGVFLIAAAVASIAGSTLAHYSIMIAPSSYSVYESIFIAAIVIIGGSANLWGSVLAAGLLVAIPELLTFVPGPGGLEVHALRLVVYGVLLVLFMRFRPQGLIPEYMRFRRARAPTYVPLPPEERVEILRRGGSTSQSERGEHNPGLRLQMEGLCKHFAGIQAVKNVSLALPEGKITALIGPNGAGKTTIFNLITGFLKADDGKVYLQGQDITGLPPHKINRLGMVRSFQDVRVFKRMPVIENVLMAFGNQSGENLARLFFRPRKVSQEARENYRQAMAYLDFFGIADKAEVMAGDLSFAEQKILVLPLLLATGADVILIDELASGIDPASMGKVLTLTRQMASWGKTICIIEHNLDVVKSIADSVYFLADGQVIAKGSPSELMADPKLVEIYFGA